MTHFLLYIVLYLSFLQIITVFILKLWIFDIKNFKWLAKLPKNSTLNIIDLDPARRHSYGYRGRDARSNLHRLPTGECVYFIAATVVLFNADEGQQRHYLGHTDDVKWWVPHVPSVTLLFITFNTCVTINTCYIIIIKVLSVLFFIVKISLH